MKTISDFLKEEKIKEEQRQQEFDENKVDYFSVKKGETKHCIIWSRINPDNNDEWDNLNDTQFSNKYSLWNKPDGYFKTNDGSGVKYINLIELDESKHESELGTPFVQVGELVGLSESKKPTFYLWVSEIDGATISSPKIYNCNAQTVLKKLDSFESMMQGNGGIMGMEFIISLHKTKPEYTVNPVNPKERFDIDEVEFKGVLEDYITLKTADEQIVFMNDIKESYMSSLDMTEDEWPFTSDGGVKEDFVPKEEEFAL